MTGWKVCYNLNLNKEEKMATKTAVTKAKTTSKAKATEAIDSKVAVKAAKDASALVTLATQLDEKLKIYDPILIKGIPVRDKYKVNVKEMRASLAKVVKALEKIKNPMIGIPVRDPIMKKK